MSATTRAARAIAIAACALLVLPGCAARHQTVNPPKMRYFAGLLIYPNSTAVGSVDASLAVFSSADAFATVADWYAAHMPRVARSARDNTTSQATWAIFASRETKTVHIEIVDGTVRVTLADVRSAPTSATGR